MPFYRVLIVDDDKDFAFSLMENLTLLGYQSVCVSSSQEALKWLKVHSLNTILILSDYELIGETGFDVRKAVKPEFGKIPFVLMSGVINQDLALQGKKERIAGFLHKPFDPNNVKDIIDKNCKEKIDEIDEELDLISGFLDDTKPLMEEIESNILSIEESKGDLSSFDNLMRLLHTIKGTAACVGLEDLSYLSHKYEDLVTATRAGKFAVNEKLTNVFLKGFDKLKEELSQSEERKVLSSEEREDMVSIFQVEDEAGIVAKDKSKDDIVKQVAAIKSLADAKREEISVSVEILDKFMELSGELTVARNASNKLLQKLEKTVGASLELDSLSESLSEIHKVCGGMQNLVVETRKVSLRHVLKTIPRVVRDLSKSTGKNIKFQIYGDDIRVDNSIAKVLSNSIIHMVRNSIDHGLEKPEERISAQKNEEGQLTIKCSDVGDDVFVELIDDGRGINRDRIKQRVIEKGMYSAQEVQEMSDKKVMSMIFEPGFSTAEVITDVSGRGVGMDMVKTSVVNINGRIDIESEKGQGTNIRLVLPKPKAVLIMSSLFVRIGHEKFAIPQAEIGRVVLLNNTSDGIMQEIQGKRYIKLSEEILPIVEIDEVLGFPVRVEGRQSNQFIVLKSELNQFAIPIDEIFDVEEVVVKKLENEMARSDLFLGVTYGDDGDLCLTLNPNAIGSLFLENKGVEKEEDIDVDDLDELVPQESSELLLVDIGVRGSFAIPLTAVYRLEKLKTSRIQIAQGQKIVKYDGRPLYIKLLKEELGFSQDNNVLNKDEVKVVVVKDQDSLWGFVVNDIRDIITTSSRIEDYVSDRPHIMGGIEHDGKTVTLVDIYYILSGFRTEDSQPLDHRIEAA